MFAMQIERHRATAHAAGRALLVTFGASWCTPCRAIAPALAAATRAPPAPVLLEVDVDRCQDDVGVCSVPTLKLYRVGVAAPVMHVGASGLDEWMRDNVTDPA